MSNLQSIIQAWLSGPHAGSQAGVLADPILDFSGSSSGVVVNLASGAVLSSAGLTRAPAGVSQVLGSHSGDLLIGGATPVTLDGGGGNDILYGGRGATTFVGGAGNNIISGHSGQDTVSYATAGPVAVDLSRHLAQHGQNATDLISGVRDVVGSPHDDVIVGDGQNNHLLGGFGHDVLTGGGGRDTFIYTDRFDFGDRITDFTSSVDTIEVSRANIWATTPPPAGRLAAADFSVNAHPATSGTTFTFDPVHHALFVDVDGPGGHTPLLLATIEPTGTIAARDILIG